MEMAQPINLMLFYTCFYLDFFYICANVITLNRFLYLYRDDNKLQFNLKDLVLVIKSRHVKWSKAIITKRYEGTKSRKY